jgi:putative ABC transport system permease protein
MTGSDLAREIARSLLAHRLRTLLAAAGIVTGVGTIVASLAVAEGARRQAVADIGTLGVDNVLVRAHRPDLNATKARVAPVLTLDDAAALAVRCRGATVAGARLTHDDVTTGTRSITATVAGVTDNWRTTAGLVAARGRWFTPADAASRTAVLGAAVARALFGADDPVGRPILAAGEWRIVVGVLAGAATPPAHGSLQTFETGDTVFVPAGALDVSLGMGDEGRAVDEIAVRVPSGDDAVRSAALVRRVLADRHPDDGAGFEVVVPLELLRARLRAERGSQILLLAVGALALLISGVGIMNIMVASVTERSMEIGVRRAVGARRRSVLLQFAVEAACLGGAGGVIGVPLGAVGAWFVARIAGWPVAVSLGGVAGALALALGVALAAGVYPARLAASVSPIEALRE